MNTINLRDKSHVALFNAVVLPNLLGPWWAASRPFNHAEAWEKVKVQIAKSEKDIGINFPKPRAYDLASTQFVDATLEDAYDAIGQKDESMKDFRKRVRKMFVLMQFDMQSPQDGPKVVSKVGAYGDHKGRPSAEMIAATAKPKKAKKTQAAKPAGRAPRKNTPAHASA